MSNSTRVTSAAQLNSVVFRDYAAAPTLQKLKSLFPGLGYAAGYKILQRIYKYSGQPIVKDYLGAHYGEQFDRTFGRGTGKAIMHATAGSLVGIGEIVLLPLDVLKIKRQTNPEAFKGRGLFKLVAEENVRLYRGWGWTAARNAPGSFALFGGNAFAKEYLFHLKDYNDATWTQNFVTSIFGASASLIASAPLDVIKTRIQNKDFNSRETGTQILRKMVREEGFSAFFKGLTPKLLTTGPKLVFSYVTPPQMLNLGLIFQICHGTIAYPNVRQAVQQVERVILRIDRWVCANYIASGTEFPPRFWRFYFIFATLFCTKGPPGLMEEESKPALHNKSVLRLAEGLDKS